MIPDALVAAATAATETYRRRGFTCAESTIRSLGDCFHLDMEDSLLKSVSAFSGGAVDDGRCGVLEAAMASAAIMLPDDSGDTALEWSRELHRQFESQLGSVQCRDLFYPRYDEHKKANLPEGDFRCVFQFGIAAIIGVLDEIERAKKE